MQPRVPVGRAHALQRSYLPYTQLLRNGPSILFRGWDAINIDALPRPCKLGCKLGHCDAEDFMDLFIYVVLGQRGKLFFINEGFKFWSIEKHSSLRKIYFPNKIWEIILIRQVILGKVKEKSDWQINLKKIINYQNYIVLIERLLSNYLISVK